MNFLLAPYVAAIVLFVAELRGRLSRSQLRLPPLPPPILVASLVVSYALQLAMLRIAALSSDQYHMLVRLGEVMPLPVVYPPFPNAGTWSALFVGLGGLQTAILVRLYRSTISSAVLWGGSVATIAISLASPVLTSFDLYGYVQNSVLERNAWAPPNIPFAGEYRIFDLWLTGPTTSLYGPLWLVIVQLVMGLAPTLLTKMLAYRVFSALLFAALIAMLRGLGQPRRILAAVALNPAFAFLTIANGHNDLIPIAFLVAAAILVRRFPVIGVALIALAGLIKLPYALLGLPVLSVIRASAPRVAAAVCAVAVTLAISWIAGGEHYLSALRQHSGSFDAAEAAHALVVVLAIAVVLLAAAGRRRYLTPVWLMPSVGSFRLPLTFPWYVLFAFPYALGRRRVLRYLLVSMPFVTALITPELMRVWTFFFTIPVAVLFSLDLRRGNPREAA